MTEIQASQILQRNAQAIEARVAAACERAGRPRASVTIVAVSKYVDAVVAGWLVRASGILDLGENRPQELIRKARALHADPQTAGVRLHQIGHLQRNKVRDLLPHVALIHSVDSVRLLATLAQEVTRLAQPAEVTRLAQPAEVTRLAQPARLPILLEVNTSGEASKQGFAPDELPALADTLAQYTPTLDVQGLMTMAALGADAATCRRSFAQLRQLRDELAGRLGQSLPHLSMGMSGDFEEAIAEGATLVRIGSSLFAGVMPESAA
jgi:pyridoxal phosphate enzyme (YggS family)